MRARRPIVKTVLAAAAAASLALLVLLGGCTSGQSDQAAQSDAQELPDTRPNIVFVLTDDLSTNLVPYMPHVLALARAGVSFRNFFVVDSLCCPSRSAIFTGLYPHDDGVYTNGGRYGGYRGYNRNNNPPRSFAVALHAAGYQTAMMGKYLNGYAPTDAPAPGWDMWDVAGNAYREYNYGLNENGVVHQFGDSPQDYLTTVLNGKASEFIKAAHSTGQPFALEVATFAPHYPWVPAPADSATFPTISAPRDPAFDRLPAGAPTWLARLPSLSDQHIHRIDVGFRRRVAVVQAVDRMIGHLERTLAALHELRNTYIVFSSDNGFHMGEHRLLPGKQTAFDTDIRVPLVIAGPGTPPGLRVDAMASSIDLAPTLLAIAGAAASDTPDGVSLLPLLHGERPSPGWQRRVLIEHRGPVNNVADPDVQPWAAGHPPSYEAMRTPRSLYVEYETGDREYYDLRTDPFELRNLAGSLSAARLARLHAALQELAACHGSAQCQRAAGAQSVP